MKIKKNYQHGGDILSFAKALNCHSNEVIDLSSNINFVKPKIALDFNTLNISSYPNYTSLYSAIVNLYTINSSQLELFNGATSAISALFRLFKLKDITLYSPCYLEYKRVARLYNYRISFIHRLTTMNQEIPENSLVIFVNPSTPDGNFYELAELMPIWVKKNCTIIIDESFLDFTPFDSATKYIEHYEKLYIIKSMTKFYASAGIRIGAVISNRKNIEALTKDEPLWKISAFDSHYLQEAIKDKTFKARSYQAHKRNKDFLERILKNSPLIEKVYPSSANFIMVKLKELNAEALQKKLKPYKVMVRDCANFDGLDNTFVRIAIKDMPSLKILEELL